ncbi:MAG: hypothetical protein LBS26_04895 [Campylobacteraceae bacterium]|jgi:hypothetical protein|nr:hypothetical protein [Campylobacteraceae bacterium]
MKKILFLLLFGLSSIYAIVDERKIDFYYGNGVWNTRKIADDSRMELKRFIINDIKPAVPYSVKLSYNYHITDAYDLLEVYYQLQREGQILFDDGFFAMLIGRLAKHPFFSVLIEQLINIISADVANIENENLDWMVDDYQRSIKDGHRVILVSHSQGNLFGVRAYDKLDSWQKRYFRQVSVATPASRVAGGGGYVTSVNDKIIHGFDYTPGIPGALAGNARNSQENLGGDEYNHEFVKSYLNGDVTQERIKGLIDAALSDVQALPSQWVFEDKPTCSIDGCEHKARNVTHRYESSLSSNMKGIKVYPFDDEGKLYLVNGGYVKANDIRGDSIEIKNDDIEICYVLKDVNSTEIDMEANETCLECNGTNSTAGFVEVSVTWGSKSADVDLKVEFPNGANDQNDQVCLFEHFYSTSDNGVKDGLYPVYVTYNEIVAIKNKWIDDIYITIKVPGKTETRSTNYNELDYLSGHVADINVSNIVHSNGSYKGTFLCKDCKQTTSRSSCIESDSKKWGYDEVEEQIYGSSSCHVKKRFYIYDIIWYISKTILGPLSGADVNIYEMKNYNFASNSGSNPIFTDKTSEGDTLLSAGNIPLIKGLDADKLYVVEVKGGLDIDANDDAKVDDTPTVNNGTVRLVMSGHEISNLGFKVNVLTEIIYQLAKGSIDENNQSVFIEKSDEIARCLLKTDMNIDGAVDTLDAIVWMPFYGKDELLNHNYSLYYEPIIDKIHKNQNIYNEALNIYKNPIFLNTTVYFLSNVTAGSAIGKVPFVCGDGFTIYETTGANAIYFNVNSSGQIIVSRIPSNTGSYPLKVSMKNSGAESVSGTVNIQMIHEYAPFLTKNRFNNAIPDIIEDGFDLGKAVIIDEGLSPLSDIWLEGDGADNFEIDKNGHIYISQRSHIDLKDAAYRLKVVASNEYGEGIPVEIIIYVYAEYELVPMVIDTVVGMYGTEIAVNKVIGKMKAAENIFCPISGFWTNSTLFGIKPNGDIYIKAYPSSNEYSISVYAQSKCGNSNVATLKIDRLNRLIGKLGVSNAKRITLSSDNTKMFIASGKDGVSIMDITNPNVPEQTGFIAAYNAHDTVLSADDTKIYVAEGEGGVKIFDLSNIQNPTLIKSITNINAQKISLSKDGSWIYVSGGTYGLKIISVSDPFSAYIAGNIDSYAVYDALQHSNDENILLTAGGFGGLKIYDISDPANPVLIGATETTYAQDIAVFDNTAYIADGSGGIRAADISNASKPIIAASPALPNAYSIAISSDNAQIYAAGGENGLFVADIKEALEPYIVNTINIIDARFIAVLNDASRAYVVNNQGRVFVIAL